MSFLSTSPEETIAYASQLTATLMPNLTDGPLVFLLSGEMGSGKTQFAKGVAQALGVKQIVASPTYVLTREYIGSGVRLVHIDCWRVPKVTPEELDLKSYLTYDTVVVIEWPEPLVPFLEAQELITLRRVSLTPQGEDRIIDVV